MNFDVVVLGTGAAGLVSALTAADEGCSVGLFEKGEAVGGSTALSGGVAWLPANRHAAARGITDDRDRALRYLRSLSNGTTEDALLEAFVDGVDPLLDRLARTPLRLRPVARYPDYHPEHPGGLPGGGRSLEPELFDTSALGEWAERITGEPRRTYIGEIPSGGGSGVLDPGVLRDRTARHLEGLGRGLVAALLRGCLDRNVPPRPRMRATRLVTEGRRVTGVGFDTGEHVRARRAVVLATGGFEHDRELVRGFLRGPIEHSPGAATNTGDGLRMALRVGASLGVMAHAWWVPVVLAATASGRRVPTLLLRERTLPGTIMVNGEGRRFTNEAANYNALGAAFHAFDVSRFRYANDPAWLIIDGRTVAEYGVFGSAPGRAPGWLARAGSAAELAAATGADETVLTETLRTWNSHVAAGRDAEFGRGESVYDGWCGDQRHYGTPRATLGELGEGPFHYTRVFPSALGTKGGPRTTPDGQVLGADGSPVDGLFAAGNAMAAPTGMVYGGAGGTLGPAMVFGHLAGRAAAGS